MIKHTFKMFHFSSAGSFIDKAISVGNQQSLVVKHIRKLDLIKRIIVFLIRCRHKRS